MLRALAKSKSTYRSRIYRDFKSLDARAFHAILRFYEENERAIRELDPEESFELLYIYADALYRTGAWRKHLLVVDLVIEYCILHNVKEIGGVDIFKAALFQKGVSLYHTHEYAKADYVLRELLRLAPEEEAAATYLRRCLFSQLPRYVQQTRALSVLLFLIAGLVVSVEVLLIRTFYAQYTEVVELSRFILFGMGVLLLVSGTLLHRYRMEREVAHFRNAMRHRKREKKRPYS